MSEGLKERIAELYRLEEGKTPGPWFGDADHVAADNIVASKDNWVCNTDRQEDALFIAAAANLASDLAHEVERLRQVLRRTAGFIKCEISGNPCGPSRMGCPCNSCGMHYAATNGGTEAVREEET